MPLWAAFALTLAAYVVRSAIRGFDFAPDVPSDVLVLVLLLVVVAAVWRVRTEHAESDDVAHDRQPDTTDPES